MDVTVLYNPDCGHCRHALETVEASLSDEPDVSIEAVDVEEHPEAAEAFDLRSCPGVAVDGTLAYVGVPSESELRERVRQAAEAAVDEPAHWARRYEDSTPHENGDDLAEV